MAQVSKINPFSIDHIVVNVDEKYQKNIQFIEQVNRLGLPYTPSKGKGNKGFKASNLWVGEEYFEFIYIKSKDGGGWIKDWVDKYNSGHRGVIGLFLKTHNIEKTSELLKSFGISNPERISFPFFFKLINFSAKWQNAYLPYFDEVPFQLGFQQVDSPQIEKKMRNRMVPNSKANGIDGIKSVQFFGPFTRRDFEWLKNVFYCINEDTDQLNIPLENGQSIHFYISETIETRVLLNSKGKVLTPLLIENLRILNF